MIGEHPALTAGGPAFEYQSLVAFEGPNAEGRMEGSFEFVPGTIARPEGDPQDRVTVPEISVPTRAAYQTRSAATQRARVVGGLIQLVERPTEFPAPTRRASLASRARRFRRVLRRSLGSFSPWPL